MMAIIQSLGTIEKIREPWYQGVRYRSVRLYDQRYYEYAALYRIQPNVRTCVDFLSRNIAQLGLHVFKKVTETDRVKLSDFGMAKLINQPLPAKYKITRYRMIESLMGDLGIYFNAYLLKLRDDQGKITGLLRVPPPYIEVNGSLVNRNYQISIGNIHEDIEPDEIIHIRGYNPENPIIGLSPLETLRRILAEEDSAGKFREELWQNGARMEGFIERPPEAAEWSDPARERFLEEFNDLYSGEGKGGKTAVLEEGMKWVNASFSSREAEYLGGRKLTREECARAYHIPLTMVGILEHATLTNIQDQHKQLYQDSLGPWLKMIEEDLDLQLLPEFQDEDPEIFKIYSEFNIYAKLAGDFNEQIKALQSAIGRPWMVADEGRARLNLPALGGDAARLVTPLNVTVGGLASPNDTDPTKAAQKMAGSEKKQFDSHSQGLRERFQLKWMEILSENYKRQERAILSRVNPALEAGKGDLGAGVWWDAERWNAELANDLIKLNLATALSWAELFFQKYGEFPVDMEAFEARMIPYLQEHSRIQAEKINQDTSDQISTALEDPEALAAVKNVFKIALTSRVIQQAISAVTSMSSFGTHEAASAKGLARKTWRVNSQNPRESHQAMDGVTVGIREIFPNGMRWPGDPKGGADELAGCLCSVEFSK